MMKWRPERRPVEGAGEHCKGLLVIDVLKLIDEIAKLAFAVGKRNALDQAPQEEFGSKPEMLLEFRTGPDRNFRDTQFRGRRANLVATLRRDTAAAHELEGVRFAGHGVHRCGHILLRLRLGQAAAIDALNDSALVRLVVERTCADDVTPLVASRLAEPSEIRPAIAKVIGEHEAFELGAAEILEVNRPDSSSYRHLPASWLPELRSGLMI
ncbi:hypothetical protein H1B27_39150 [Bradyrhizobium sp. CNPSo 4019]|uniref:Uncharacterized protein n=1 Tax=Bradyrhizobium diversitatis TaxID=2755406 RepID=A0ABS0PFZ6_9BRAD|nr:hypothetical protein [Bradyrhizobium diversitatis]MBH5392221.1 hypothetical protein [Bradyrhizobium diversitatis]